MQKNEYIAFWFQNLTTKVSKSPLFAGNDVIQMRSDVKYLEGILDNKLNFNKDITMKIKIAVVKLHTHKGNVKIPLKTGMHNTSTHVIHITFGLWQCTTVWSTKEIQKQIPNNKKHVC